MLQEQDDISEKALDFLDRTKRIDGYLRLRFIVREMTSPPEVKIPVYKFRMVNAESGELMGEINLRAGFTENIRLYRGNIGFTVYEDFRGDYLSARSCQLLEPFIMFLGLGTIWLTCNTDNIASKKNIEYLGATYVETVHMPENSPYIGYYPPHARIKLRYRWDLSVEV